MLGGHIGRCFDGVDDDTYDSDGHYREPVVYNSKDYNSDGEYVGHDDDEEDGDSNWETNTGEFRLWCIMIGYCVEWQDAIK